MAQTWSEWDPRTSMGLHRTLGFRRRTGTTSRPSARHSCRTRLAVDLEPISQEPDVDAAVALAGVGNCEGLDPTAQLGLER